MTKLKLDAIFDEAINALAQAKAGPFRSPGNLRKLWSGGQGAVHARMWRGFCRHLIHGIRPIWPTSTNNNQQKNQISPTRWLRMTAGIQTGEIFGWILRWLTVPWVAAGESTDWTKNFHNLFRLRVIFTSPIMMGILYIIIVYSWITARIFSDHGRYITMCLQLGGVLNQLISGRPFLYNQWGYLSKMAIVTDGIIV